jgi:soluble lytic murein transglycosylase-like protein
MGVSIQKLASGAVGIMQVIPKYAAAPPINVADVSTPEGNIEAGVKMLRNIEKQFLNDPNMDPLDKTLMTFASYNAGPNGSPNFASRRGRKASTPISGLIMSS